MTPLARIQECFLAAVVDADSEARAPAIHGGEGSRRLAVYRRNVHANWRAALADTFPVVARLVGDAFFGEAARRYALAHPSRSGDLHHFGRHFAHFLEGYPHARELPWLGDVARLEWAWHEAFHAAAAAPLDLAALARVPPEDQGRIRFQLHPSTRLVASPHPVLSIWEANQPERDGAPDRVVGADVVLVHRPDMDVLVRRVAPEEGHLVRALERGETLEAAAEAAGLAEAAALTRTLRKLVAARVIAGFAAP